MSQEVPSRPWEKITTDIVTLDGKDYLVTIDYYSNFWEVDRLPSTKASTTILKRKALYNIVLNQMSPRHISGILYEYPQFTM